MSEDGSTRFPESVTPSEPVAQYTPSNPAVEKGTVKSFIDSLQYQNDPVATLQLSMVLQQMPDFMKEFPYLGAPLHNVQTAVEENEVLEDTPCRVILGFRLRDDAVQTMNDIPDVMNGVFSVDVFREFLQEIEGSIDRLIEDIGVFAFQYSDPSVNESNHTLLYVSDPVNYNYFVDFDDRFVIESETGGSVFQSLSAVEFTDAVADVLRLKSEMLIDVETYDDAAEKLYQNRFVLPLITPFNAVFHDPTGSGDHQGDQANSMES